ncbi:MAG TPA: HAD family phosphatase [Steroidobacteraceae bacterium]|nr:HAD family phosphatase [Steroidobacteraceae bacterium]
MIRDVVFDIGWVFVELHPQPILEHFADRAVAFTDIQELVARVGLEDHETGRLNGQGFLQRLHALAPERLDPAELHVKWLDMFRLEPRMVELAHSLAARYGVYLLSNIGDLHWEHLCREYGIHRIGHGALPSFVAGHMKPHAGIYLEAERRFNLTPAATVFIDDRAENIAAARERGWHGIVHESFEKTRAALQALGVEL